MMASQAPSVTLKIGIAGPTRVGKTTLITSLLRSGQEVLAGSPVAIRPADRPTANRIAAQRQEIDGSLLAGSFRSTGLASTQEPTVYKLVLDPGVLDAQIGLELLDFPGSWLDPKHEITSENEQVWEDCQTFIADSSVLLVPIDAAVLMESVGDDRRHVPGELTTDQVEEVARRWARRRREHPGEPSLLLLCPVKSETYFADNGGRRNRSEDLLDQVRAVYDGVLRAVRAEAPGVRVLYSPVDTIGSVEIVAAQWTPDAVGHISFKARYRVRRPAVIRLKGVEDVLVLLIRHLLDTARHRAGEQERVAGETAEAARERARLREGMWREFWKQISGEQNRRNAHADTTAADFQVASQRREALQTVLENLASRDLGPRVREI